MSFIKRLHVIVSLLISGPAMAQQINTFINDFRAPELITGYTLAWNDEFNKKGVPDTSNWVYENGFMRNEELQWYQPENAECAHGSLIIMGRRQPVKNPGYKAGSGNWKTNRQYANYTSASIQTRGLHSWKFGRFEIRAKIDTAIGSWPAIWTLGINKDWPSNGEVDVMEFYRVQQVPTILANVAWGTDKPNIAKWHTERIDLAKFISRDEKWADKFHIWRMDWDKDSIKLFLDDELLNKTLVSETLNADGSNPFLQPQFLLLNLAIGGNGGEPGNTGKPIKYEVDYVRVYQKNE